MKKYLFIGFCALLVLAINSSCEEIAAQSTNPEESLEQSTGDAADELACYTVVVGETAVDNMSSKQLQVDCPEGMRAMGAGWSVLDGTGAILDGQATYFQPSYNGTSWLTNAKNESGFEPNWKLRVRLICACEVIF